MLVATPFSSFSSRICMRRHLGSLVNPTLDPEKVLRVRLHRLSSRTLLVNLDREALSDIHSLFCDPFQQDIMDIFAPCNFANIQGYPNDLPNNGMDMLPSFQGNNVVSAMDHIKAFSCWLGKHARGVDYNHEDGKMSLFVLSLEEDALDWFT